MNTAAAPKPFLPSDLPADKILVRAATAYAVAAAQGPGERPERIAREFWPRDSATLSLIERAATAPATTTTAGWAAELAGRAAASFVGSLQESAAARLIAASTTYAMPGVATITLPRTATVSGAFVAEGAPIPVAQAVITGPTLGPPKKLAVVEAITRELAEATPDDAETIISTILKDGLTRVLDSCMFDSAAASTVRPAGLLNGLTGLTATTPGGGEGAALADLRAMVDAIVTAGGSGNIVFVASPGRALAVRTWAPSLADRVFGSAAIPAGTLIAVDANSFCSMFGSDVEIRASKEAVLHFEDSTPLQLSTGAQGSAVLATPARSVFQTDSVAFRAVLRAAWALRVPGAVSFVTNGLSW